VLGYSMIRELCTAVGSDFSDICKTYAERALSQVGIEPSRASISVLMDCYMRRWEATIVGQCYSTSYNMTHAECRRRGALSILFVFKV